jgi:pimeloyl-ACP methyl ester carboxylesterase
VISEPKIVKVGERGFAVEDAGPATGLPVICHHGGSRHLFPGAVRYDARASGLRLISYDRPAQGLSSPQAGRVVADCAVDVHAITDALGITKAAVWGTSAGGPYALATAALPTSGWPIGRIMLRQIQLRRCRPLQAHAWRLR